MQNSVHPTWPDYMYNKKSKDVCGWGGMLQWEADSKQEPVQRIAILLIDERIGVMGIKI